CEYGSLACDNRRQRAISIVTGRGAHTDIILASALAFVHALNRLEARSSSISLMTPLQQEAAAV
ncbi:MAG: alpha-isopropylmalate synthase regulatory domain-containing protein, partial [SAR324 cluster bacterium]|nr:alpha-isopropylmalate synthase regulatory domain-containing protein [SAR324 cluster bacterium]